MTRRHHHDDELGLLYAASDADAAGVGPLEGHGVPPAHWDRSLVRMYDPRVRWGDEEVLEQIAANSVAVPTRQLVQFGSRRHTPREVKVFLSTSSPQVAAPGALVVATWQVDFGCGSALVRRFFQQQVEPASGSAITDLTLSFLAQVILVKCFVTTGALPGPVDVSCVAMAAPVIPSPLDENDWDEREELEAELASNGGG